jgi:XTP/dITP diphosphohydrolase
MRLLIATTNPDKLREIRACLADEQRAGETHASPLLSLTDLPPMPEPEETGATFQENARLKAFHYSSALASARSPNHHRLSPIGSWQDLLIVAEDSGLVIDALGDEPGVRSARFLRPDASYPQRFAEIYRRLAHKQRSDRRARFICALAVVQNHRIVFETTGVVEGEIADAPRGTAGFGYDPIFYYPPYRRTLAEVTEEEKLLVAHRGKAFRTLAEWLKRHRGTKNGER